MARKKRTPRVKIHEITAENDIRFRGPLTFQHFQILGWLCIVASQAALILRTGAKLDPAVAEMYQSMGPWLEAAADLSLPLLLIANFAQILDSSDGYRMQLIKNAGAALGVFLGSYLFFNRYIAGALAAVSTNPADAKSTLEDMVHLLLPNRFISFNLFIDLFLCSLVMLFLNYKPKHIFKGKLVLIFRFFTLLPIAYEVICMVLKVQSAKGLVWLPLWSFPLLPVKPPMTFVLFILLAAFVKIRELRFRRHGKTHEEYQEFLKTRKNSWNFSVFLAIMMVVVSLLDVLVVASYSIVGAVQTMNQNEMIAAEEAAALQNTEEAAALTSAEETDVLPSAMEAGSLPSAEKAPALQDAEETAALPGGEEAGSLSSDKEASALPGAENAALNAEEAAAETGAASEEMDEEKAFQAFLTLLAQSSAAQGNADGAGTEEGGALSEATPEEKALQAFMTLLAQSSTAQGNASGEAAEEGGASSEQMSDTDVLMMLMMLLGQSDLEALPVEEEAPAVPLTEEEKAQLEQERLIESLETEVQKEMNTALALGFGGSVNMLLLAPLVLLFSYTKSPRNSQAGLFIPMGGMALILILYLEAIRMALWNLPLSKIDLTEVSEMLQMVKSMM